MAGEAGGDGVSDAPAPNRRLASGEATVALAGGASWRATAAQIWVGECQSGRDCLGGRNAPAGGRQARPDLSGDKSGKEQRNSYPSGRA